MQKEEIIHHLKTNPAFAIEIVVDNNPSQVASNVAKVYGQIKEYSIDQLKDLIFEILDNGTRSDKDKIYQALRVRWIPEHASPTLNEAFNDIYGQAQKVKALQGQQAIANRY